MNPEQFEHYMKMLGGIQDCLLGIKEAIHNFGLGASIGTLALVLSIISLSFTNTIKRK